MVLNLKCPSCGGVAVMDKETGKVTCTQCGNIVNVQPGDSEPDCIIPFSISKESAESLIRGRFCRGWFVPREIKKLQVDKIREIYIPYFLTTVHVREKIKLAKRRKAQRYAQTGHSLDDIPDDFIERKVNFISSQDVECVMVRIPCDASLRLADNISGRLEPYDWEELVPFSPEYLSGCYADKFDVPPSVIVERTKRRAEYKLIDMEYALLPAWFMTFTYKGRQYTAAVNGQTGKVVGSIPANKAKIWTVFAALVVLLCAPVGIFCGVSLAIGVSSRIFVKSNDPGNSEEDKSDYIDYNTLHHHGNVDDYEVYDYSDGEWKYIFDTEYSKANDEK